jgi:ABC-type multidrug transport system ATPase subunit
MSGLKLNSKKNFLTSRTSGMNGSITINGQERNLSQFRKLSCYIMQDNQLHANLTVEEAMYVASNLKLGKEMTKDEKQEVVSSGTQCRQLYQIKKT